MIIKKRQLVTATLIIALGTAIFVNRYYTKPNTETLKAQGNTTTVTARQAEVNDNLGDAQYVLATGTAEQEDAFSQWELKRSKAHDEAAEILNRVINDEGANQKAIEEASDKLAELSENVKLEADIETLVGAKTGSTCLVMLDGACAQAIVLPGILDETISVQIKDIIVNKTGLSTKNITIIELNG